MYSKHVKLGFNNVLHFLQLLRVQLSNPRSTRGPILSAPRESQMGTGKMKPERLTPRRHDEAPLLPARCDTVEPLDVGVV